jgi:hypothetical protein
MPQLIQTVEEYIATTIKRQGYWMVFNTVYNDVHAFNKPAPREEDGFPRYLAEEDTDQQARAEFIDFMQTHYPDVKTYQVMDLVGLSNLIWPYLGSFAIDMQPGDEVYKALSEKYNDPEQDGKLNHAVLWTMRLEDAEATHRARVEQTEAWLDNE